MPTVVIIGASRGIGLGFAQAYAAEGWEVHATTRTPENPGELADIAGNVSIRGLDVRNADQISALAEAFEGGVIDHLINSAGVLRGVDRDEMMAVNADAPFNIVAALFDAVARSTHKKIAILTSQMGARHGGGTPSDLYGESKCILNDRFREIEPEWRAAGVTSVVFHPGWVATDMGGRSASVSIDESVTGMRRVIAGLAPADSGKFLTWSGAEHPW
ncbi:MAG: SDR family NAD(P)-dependent oxidoreductase [Rhodospirillaceae bacterium]|nr:SDR family NAD(P)-dependent oxidoreductase [Rhodospirillaceae bacterium]MBT6535592.1 SDR family NAD(P)-dependent oxidoreductase [Rhodospirillaceae bacterium]MBT7362984.1 SDR family NAD(P)-dependent oxidoreductase [Rhodospirillaceae bacterium]